MRIKKCLQCGQGTRIFHKAGSYRYYTRSCPKCIIPRFSDVMIPVLLNNTYKKKGFRHYLDLLIESRR